MTESKIAARKITVGTKFFLSEKISVHTHKKLFPVISDKPFPIKMDKTTLRDSKTSSMELSTPSLSRNFIGTSFILAPLTNISYRRWILYACRRKVSCRHPAAICHKSGNSGSLRPEVLSFVGSMRIIFANRLPNRLNSFLCQPQRTGIFPPSTYREPIT